MERIRKGSDLPKKKVGVTEHPPKIFAHQVNATRSSALNYPELLPCWPRSSVGRAPVDLFRRSWVQTPLGPTFLWSVGTSKIPLKRVVIQGDLVYRQSIAYYRHLNINLNSIISISRVLHDVASKCLVNSVRSRDGQ